MNYKNERIWKLHKLGHSPEWIAKKTGLSLERVLSGIAWMKSVEQRSEHGE